MNDATDAPPILAMVIPIVAIVFGVGIGMLGLYLGYRRKSEAMKMYHEQRMAAIEKGIELPPIPADLLRDDKEQRKSGEPAYVRHRRTGLVLLLIGIAVTVVMYWDNPHGAPWGLVPAAIGLAYLISGWLEAREQRSLPPPAPPREDAPPSGGPPAQG